jgi:hypothetical protein
MVLMRQPSGACRVLVRQPSGVCSNVFCAVRQQQLLLCNCVTHVVCVPQPGCPYEARWMVPADQTIASAVQIGLLVSLARLVFLLFVICRMYPQQLRPQVKCRAYVHAPCSAAQAAFMALNAGGPDCVTQRLCGRVTASSHTCHTHTCRIQQCESWKFCVTWPAAWSLGQLTGF